MKLVDFAPNLEKKKRDELLRTLFNPKKFKEATTITKSNEPKRPRVYCCPKCGHKDYTLAVFRHAKTADEKWNEVSNLAGIISLTKIMYACFNYEHSFSGLTFILKTFGLKKVDPPLMGL